MSMGTVYVPPTASSANGIAVLTSSPTTSGSTGIAGFLNWSSDGGFQSKGWYFNDPLNPLSDWWSAHYNDPVYVGNATYSNSLTGFADWMRLDPPNDLNAALGSWDEYDKIIFVSKYDNTPLSLEDCITH